MRRTHPRLATIVLFTLGAVASQGCDVVAAPLDENAPHLRTVLEVNANLLRRSRLDTLTDEARGALRNAEPSIRVIDGGVVGDTARVRLADPADSERGSFTPHDTRELALLLRAGALPAALTIVEQRTVGAR